MKTLKDYAKPGAQWAFYKDELSAELLCTCIILESELKDISDDEHMSEYYEWTPTILIGSDEVHTIREIIDLEDNRDYIWYERWDRWPPSKFDNCYFMPFEFIDDFVEYMNGYLITSELQ